MRTTNHPLQGRTSPFTPYWGASPLQLVLAEADLLEIATLNELNIWDNGCSTNLGYEAAEGEMATEQQRKQLISQFEARHQGVDKAGSVFVGRGKVYSLNATAREMQYRDGQVYYSQLILAAYRVPESKVRLNDANLASSKTGNIEFLNEGIRPMLVRMAEVLTEELLIKRLGVKPGELWFAYDDIVPTDIAAVQGAVVANVQNGIWTPDEARAELGYGPLPEGQGERLRLPVGGMGTMPAQDFGGDPETTPAILKVPIVAVDGGELLR